MLYNAMQSLCNEGIRKANQTKKATLERSRTPVIKTKPITMCGVINWSAAQEVKRRGRCLDADRASDANLRLLRIANEEAEAGSEFFAFADQLAVSPNAVLEDIAGQCTIRPFSVR